MLYLWENLIVSTHILFLYEYIMKIMKKIQWQKLNNISSDNSGSEMEIIDQGKNVKINVLDAIFSVINAFQTVN